MIYFELDVDLVRPVRRADDNRALGTPCAEPIFALLQSCIENGINYDGGSNNNTCLGWLAQSGVRRSRHSPCSADHLMYAGYATEML